MNIGSSGTGVFAIRCPINAFWARRIFELKTVIKVTVPANPQRNGWTRNWFFESNRSQSLINMPCQNRGAQGGYGLI